MEEQFPLTLYYCYDAYCGWCYGFSPVIKRLYDEYGEQLYFEVLSGGMILPEEPVHISASADYIAKAYPTVEEYTGIRFGQDYLWHISNPEQSDWFPNSEKPAIALCIVKEINPEWQVPFAADLQFALHYEGRDLCDDEAYRYLLEKYDIPAADFYEKLHSEEFKDKAHHEFALVKHLQVNGYPSLFLQTSPTKFYLLARGYSPYEELKNNLDRVMGEIEGGGRG